MSRADGIRATYDRVVDEYVQRIFHELDGKPFDRELLDRFAAQTRGTGLIVELGCGPGHVTRYLHERGARVIGVDRSEGMVRRARELSPRIEFHVADMRALPFEAGTVAGMVSFYSIIHFELDALTTVFDEWRRVLAPGAPALVAFHVGDEALHVDDWWGHEVSLDFHFFDAVDVESKLRAAGFDVVEASVRDPYPNVEHPSRRAYLEAVAPSAASRGVVREGRSRCRAQP
jgi:SAM-dependent methyltransferase